MKRLCYEKIYIGVLTCATIGMLYAFTNSSFGESEKDDEDWCVDIDCGSSSKHWKETIRCNLASTAKEIAKKRYPDCRISVTKGACN